MAIIEVKLDKNWLVDTLAQAEKDHAKLPQHIKNMLNYCRSISQEQPND